jgi:hypothetical protein
MRGTAQALRPSSSSMPATTTSATSWMRAAESHTGLDLGTHAPEAVAGGDRDEAVVAHVAELEGSVGGRGHREKLRIEGGDVAVHVHVDDRERTVHVGGAEAGAAGRQAGDPLELADAQPLGLLQAVAPEHFEEAAVTLLQAPLLIAGGLQAGAGVVALGLLHVEAHVADVVLEEKGRHRLSVVERIGGEHADHLEGDAAALQPADAPQGGRVARTTGAGAAMGIVQKGRAVEADAHVDVVARKAVAPGRIDDDGVGLQGLQDRVRGEAAAGQQGPQAQRGLVVEGHRQRQGLAGMPEQGEGPGKPGALQHPLHRQLQQIQ